MARRLPPRKAAPRPRRPRPFEFEFIGWADGWYVLRAATAGQRGLDAHAFENEVLEWLIDQDITPNDLSYLANGNTGDGPVVPALPDGSALCLLLRNPTDVLRLEMRFPCSGITPEAFHAAVKAEASVHKFVLADIAQIAHDAIRRMVLLYGDDMPPWDHLSDEGRQFTLQIVREFLEQPDRPANEQHARWVDLRLAEGWHYGAEIDFENHQHPLLMPFNKLSAEDQAKRRLLASTVASLAPLLGPRA